ncbi:MAG: hypothetical protein EA405_09010 [Rhodospirillales bacterium]|nr:MAG: hypothetical protein EA405_09010 [Rhodospirillales bacterium]
MKRLLALGVALAAVPLATACTELYSGPQVVRYSDTAFYVRHIPWVDGEAGVNTLAAELCRDVDGEVALTDQQQVYPFDIRYATYRCILPPPEPAPTRAPGLKPEPEPDPTTPLYMPFEAPVDAPFDRDPMRDARGPAGDDSPA